MPTLPKVNAFDESQIPSSGIINPFEVIEPSAYGMNRKGQREYQHDLAQLQYLADLRQQEFQNQYNSPANQARLMRDAGLNPDLLGIDGVAQSQNVDSPNFSGADIPTNGEVAMNVFSVVSSTFSLASSLMTGGLSMFSGLADIDAKNIDNVSRLLGLGTDVAGMVAPLGSAVGSSDIMNDSIVASYSSGSVLPLNARNRRRLKSLNGVIRNSPQANAKFWQSSEEAEQARQDTAKLVSSPYTADDFNEMVECFRPVTKAIADNLLSSLNLDSKKLKYEDQYYTTANDQSLGAISAGADYASRYLAKSQDTMMQEMKRPLQSLIKNLDAKAKEGKNWANFALISLYTALSATINRSSGQSINGATGEVFENSSWNFGF